ncbi:YbhB/YbcL family Raf kinase inhibitor-like protein [Phormidium sp. LEGE 05292]|uniref:YbhB/YbcL family Raf kinase inhibitor-like protein n=1 Tax=[Phormidium] sp. LEGE 05292 TaxID=767427 RepID=UPI0018815F03|nr:YbhB/YbcL family Raf kinase inhibitor-like protein [Phormidium sp. LEGE 05292]MBE9225374.1 YbhB/YbcL family Raf kinase inhibitor-like protein [Phormidium sp. LEGE 05292]
MSTPIARRIFLQHSINLLGLVGLSLASCSPINNPSTNSQLPPKVKTMKLESDAFSANSMIPSKYTCDGRDFSPPLKWDAPPTGTQSLALIVDDPDAPMKTFVHWVLYDLPPEITSLPEAIPGDATLADGGTQGKSDFGKLGYGGPCPPSGTHRYFFKLYALDRTLELASGATKEQLEAAMNGHILAAAELIGFYSRQR